MVAWAAIEIGQPVEIGPYGWLRSRLSSQQNSDSRFSRSRGRRPTWRAKNARLREVFRRVGPGVVVLETDSPYLPPQSSRGKRNEPSYVKEIVKKIAEIKGLPETEVAEAIIANAKRLFGI